VSTTSALLDRAYDVMVNRGATATSAARGVRALADAGMLTDPRDQSGRECSCYPGGVSPATYEGPDVVV
jgi:hypothetical protein